MGQNSTSFELSSLRVDYFEKVIFDPFRSLVLRNKKAH